MDEDVQRLRKVRESATRVRGLAFAFARAGLSPSTGLGRSTSAVSKRAAWAAGDRLNSYPHRSFRRGLTRVERLAITLWVRYLARRCKSQVQAKRRMLAQVLILKRLVDDTRSLTRSTELSAALGPVQGELCGLVAEWQSVAVRGAPRIHMRTERCEPAQSGLDGALGTGSALREQAFLGLLAGGEPRGRSRSERQMFAAARPPLPLDGTHRDASAGAASP